MKIISTIYNYIVSGTDLVIGKEIEVSEEDAKFMLDLPGVIQVKSELLIESKISTPSHKEL